MGVAFPGGGSGGIGLRYRNLTPGPISPYSTMSSRETYQNAFWRKPNRTEPHRTEPNRTEPNRTEPNRTEPNRTEPNRTEPNRTEPNRTEPNRTEPNRTEPNRTEPNRTEPRRRMFIPGTYFLFFSCLSFFLFFFMTFC